MRQKLPHDLWDTPYPALPVHDHNLHIRLADRLSISLDELNKGKPCTAQLRRPGFHGQNIIDSRRLSKIDFHPPDRKGQGLAGLASSQIAVMNAKQPQIVRPAPFEKIRYRA